jgi:hypothetical protein
MNPQFQEQLRNSMDQFTEHVEMPAGLAQAACRRWHKRRVMTRAAVAATAAVAAGAAVVITAAPGGTGTAQAQDEAYVVTRVENALAAVGHGNNIAFARTIVTSLDSAAAAPSVPYRTILTWNTRDRFNDTVYTSSGRPLYRLMVTRVPGGLEMLEVQYTLRLVFHRELTGVGTARGCSTAAALLGVLDFNPGDLTNWPVTIRALIGCNLLRVAGHQRAGGVDLIRFVQAQVPAGYPSMTLLVNPSTFLPSRVTVTLRSCSWFCLSQSRQGYKTITEFGSLPPTRANLAHLSDPIPAGFTQYYEHRAEAADRSVSGQITSWAFGQ